MKRLFITALISLVAGLVLGFLASRQIPPTREQVMNYITSLSMGDFREFSKSMNVHLGFQAFTPQLMPSLPLEPSK
jgi:Na+/H+ antiporter NhaC